MRKAIALIVLLIFSGTNRLNAQDIKPFEILPQEIDGWEIGQDDRTYDSETLYDYIDGGAELFLSYGFQKVYSRLYSQPDQPDIFVDIFEMNSSVDAFGVFSQSREKDEYNFGQGSQQSKGSITFWNDKYYVSIISGVETAESKTASEKIAAIIDAKIEINGPLPKVLNYLPKVSVQKETLRYFRHHHWLNSHSFISYDNLLNINQQTHAVLTKMNFKGSSPTILLIEYPSDKDAVEAYNKFIDNYLPELKSESLVEREGKYFGGEVIERLLIFIMNASIKENVEDLIDEVKYNWGKKYGNKESDKKRIY